jgi:hypothetical protein
MEGKVQPCKRLCLYSEGWQLWEDRMLVLPAKMLVSERMCFFSPEFELFVKMLHVALKTFLLCEVYI